jgi:hypothetical protein
MATDTSGRQAVDFVWGNIPMQPNEDRAGAVSPANFSANSSGDNFWGATTRVASDRLNPALSFHDMVEAKYAGFPEFTGNNDGAYISGVPYIVVPSVIGDTTAVALDELKDAGYETANITTATAATNLRTDVTRFNATSTTAATIYATSANTNYPVGTKVTLVAGTPAASSPVNLPAYAIGTFTVTAVASGQITVSGTGFTVADTTGINSTLNLAGLAGTIKSQSTAAGASSVATTATITITPYAAATVS